MTVWLFCAAATEERVRPATKRRPVLRRDVEFMRLGLSKGTTNNKADSRDKTAFLEKLTLFRPK